MRATLVVLCVAATLAAAQLRPIVEFQRAADAYAFLHRQLERRLGFPHQREAIAAAELASAIVAERRRASPPELFTPPVVMVFRELAIGAVHRGCDAGELRSGAWEMFHGVHSPATGSRPVSACMADALPPLPDELEYRSAGTVLLLVDAHANLVVDALPALLAGSEIR